ncbi:MAG TPA: hypothetical protein DD730_01055 [Desulfosporosinus sp.]|jgi:hypothetical protein|nr:hypothetical protein [Desulfosporosinus sp.]
MFCWQTSSAVTFSRRSGPLPPFHVQVLTFSPNNKNTSQALNGLSATVVIVAIQKSKKDDTLNHNSKAEVVLDGLVEDGTMTAVQQIAIQSAITTAKEVKETKKVDTANPAFRQKKTSQLQLGHQNKNLKYQTYRNKEIRSPSVRFRPLDTFKH